MGVRIALIVLGSFAVAWSWVGLHLSGAPTGLMIAPIAVSLAIVAVGWRAAGTVPARGPRVGRLVGLWTAIEFVALFVTANILVNVHRADLMLPAGAIIVGLHFFPLARGIPVRIYNATGAGLVSLGLIGLLLPVDRRPILIGLGAAAILWATALAIIVQARRSAAAPLTAA